MPDAETDADSTYLLGSHDAELARLAFQHRVWAEAAYALWRRAGFRRGDRLLDLGCGPGFASLDLAHLVGPEGRVVAADAAPRFLDHVRRLAAGQGVGWIEPVEVDAARLDLGERFDGAYARWLLCFLAEPERAVDGVARHLAPGGRFAVTDYFNYRAFTLAPRSAAFDRMVGAVQEMWRASGGDLDVMSRVPAIFERAGLAVVEVRQVSRTARPGSPEWAWPIDFFRGFLPRVVDAGLLAAGEVDELWADWEARRTDPGAFLALPPLLDVVGERRS